MRPGGLVVVWPASGFMLACLLLAASRWWPALLIGGLIGNIAADVTAGARFPIAIQAGLANGLEVLLAAWIVVRFGGRPITLTTLRQVGALVVGAAVFSNGLTAFMASVFLAGGFRNSWLTGWLTWWIGDGLGMLLVTPMIIGGIAALSDLRAISRRTLIEAVIAFAALAFVTELVLGQTLRLPGALVAEPYVLLPLLFVAVIRFGPLGASMASLILGAVTIWDVAHGEGAFAAVGQSATGQAVRIYVFLATASLTGLFASAMLGERERAHVKERAQSAAIADAARQAAFVADVATALTEEADLPTALRRSTTAMVHHLHAAVARIWLCDDEHARWDLVAETRGAADSRDISGLTIVGQPVLERIAATGQPYIANDLPGAPALRAAPDALRLASCAGYPLTVNRRVLGVMAMFASQPLPDSAVQALESVARTLALGLERRQLNDSRARLAAILEATPDFVTIGRLDGPPLFVNRAARRALGIGLDEPVTSLYAFRPPEFQRFFETVAIDLAERDGSWTGESEYVSRDGRVIPVSQVSIVHPGAGGDTAFISTISRDITEEKRAAEALQQSDERMNLALEAAQASTWVHDLDSDTITASGGGGSRSREEFLQCVHPDDREAVAREIRLQHESADRFDFEYREIAADGGTHWIRTRGRVFRDSADRPVRVLGVDLDITERKQLEEQLRQAQKIEAVGQLAGGLAHDFNNILTAILGYARLLEESFGADDPRKLDAEEISKAGQRASALTRQLLGFSRKQILQPVVLNLNGVIEGIVRMLRLVAGEHIAVELKLDAQLGNVKIDPGQVEQILVNLVVNARDAMEQGGSLEIGTSTVDLGPADADRLNLAAPGPHVMLLVRDTGTGMTPETQRKIFEPFFTTKGAGKGTGLGLATVFGIVKASGGAVVVESQVGEGTTFGIFFPQTSEQPAEISVAAPVSLKRAGSQTVLVVDDDPGVLAFASALLKREGYTVLAADDSRAAADLFATRQEAVDLLLTDVVLPGTDGPALFAEMRSKQPSLRVVYMSGFADETVAQRGVLGPGTPFVSKPFTSDALLRKVREALAAPAD